jgi:hypothetical protein
MGKHLSLKGNLAEFTHIKELDSLMHDGISKFELRYEAVEDNTFTGFYHIDNIEVALLDAQEHEKECHKAKVRDIIGGAAMNRLSSKALKKLTEESLENIIVH